MDSWLVSLLRTRLRAESAFPALSSGGKGRGGREEGAYVQYLEEQHSTVQNIQMAGRRGSSIGRLGCAAMGRCKRGQRGQDCGLSLYFTRKSRSKAGEAMGKVLYCKVSIASCFLLGGSVM